MGPIVWLITFFVLLFLTVPIGISIGMSIIIYFTIYHTQPISFLCQNMFTACDSFPLMAIPFFVAGGALMTQGGITKRLVDLAEAVIGHVTGGFAMVTAICCAFFGAISGSAPATVAAIGSLMVPAMIERGYSKSFALALIATSGCLGVIIPPSIPMVIFGTTTGASVGTLFIAGIGPGIVFCLALCLYSYAICKKHGWKGNGQKFSIKKVGHELKNAIWALLAPIIILGSIYGGICSPTEAGAIAGFYALVISLIVYRCLGWKELKSIFVATAQMVGRIAITVGCASAIVYIAGLEKLPVYIGGWLLGLTDNKYLFLLIINLGFLLMGMGTVQALHIDLIHFGVIFVVNMMIGLLTPPFGNLLFTTSAITSAPMNKLIKRLIPMIGVLFVCLLLLTYIPQFSTFLPSMMLGK